jgi:hypothetical protein
LSLPELEALQQLAKSAARKTKPKVDESDM